MCVYVNQLSSFNLEATLMINSHIFYWLITGIILLCFEMGHPGLFFFLSFACAAFITAGASWLVSSFIFQASIFLISGLLSFVILKFWLKWKHNFSHSHFQSNVYALVGKRGIVTEEITPIKAGQVKVAGEMWSARPVVKNIIRSGTEVEIINIQGCHLIVRTYTQVKENT